MTWTVRLAPVGLACAVLLVTVTEPLRAQAPLSLRVTTRARSLKQGEVVLVTVTTSREVARLDGGGFGGDVGFWRTGTATRWQGLVGIPLEAETGRRDLVVKATAADGATAFTRATLEVVRARFEERRLKVEDRFADPPQSEVERILSDAKRLEELFTSTRPGRLWSGPWQMPVPGTATSSFGRQTFLNGEARGRHQGADFRAGTGTPIRAPNGGEVVLAQDLYFSGNTVVLDHGQGLYSLFAHLSKTSVMVGARLARGDIVGEVGATGRVTGPHLHWAIRLHNTSVDPISLVYATAGIDTVPAARQPGK